MSAGQSTAPSPTGAAPYRRVPLYHVPSMATLAAVARTLLQELAR
ncbi:MAG: hypothetical protein ACYCTZ_07775 [Candidatus Dormibacteria bacterium]